MEKQKIIEKVKNIGFGMMIGGIIMLIASLVIWSIYGDVLIARFAIAFAVGMIIPVMVVQVTMVAGVYPEPGNMSLLGKITYYVVIFPTVDIWSVYGLAHVVATDPGAIPSLNQYMMASGGWPFVAALYLILLVIGVAWRLCRLLIR